MYPKCSLSDSNIYLQIVGLLSLVIIIIIAGFYYIRVYHNTIKEKYEQAVIYKTEGQLETGNRSTFPRDKYPGAQMNLIGTNTPPTTTDKYELRDCKVYFTDDTGACDGKGDDAKTCSYKYDGWQEFATYTDKNGKTIEYPKKIYKQDASNTNELINSYFTSKCFKKFDNNGDGRPQPFEYKENNLVKYDSKGSMNNTEIDTNVFGGKKYTSMQFLNTTSPSDNFNNVLDSICSIRYNPIKELVGKKFYKFVLDANKNISNILKVQLNSDQTTFDIINNNAVLDFSFLGSHGLKFVSGSTDKLEVFITSADIVKPVNVYKFSYVSYICPADKKAQISNFLKTSTEINITNFIQFGGESQTATSANNPFTLPYLDRLTASKYTTANTDYKTAMLKELADKRDARVTALNGESSAEKDALDKKITDKDAEIFAADRTRNSYSIPEGTFTKVIDLTKANSKIFNYNNGYNNTNLSKLVIPTGCEVIMIENTGDVCLIFKNKGENQTSYDFSVPASGYTCDILLVGGGGGGTGAGGGGGGYVYNTNINLPAGTYTVKVGNGGTGSAFFGYGNYQVGNQGYNSTFSGGTINYTAYGGGSGGANVAGAPSYTTGQVGSYGGTGMDFNQVQTYTSSQGNRGGNSIRFVNYASGGGGGGAGAVGGSAYYVPGLFCDPGRTITYSNGGKGGDGLPNSITGTTIYYAGGGTGGANTDFDTDRSTQIAPLGGGGLGSRTELGNGGNGTDGLGGGGGGGDFQRTAGSKGGSGTVIIRYRLQSQRTAAIPLKDLNNNMNDSPDLYVSNNITNNIKTSMNDYLYYSLTLYNDYKNTDTTVMDIFSIMNYTGNNKDNYRYLATYLNNKVDYFNTDKLIAEKKEFQRQLQTHIDNSSTTITGDQEIIKIDNLSNNIKAINYNEKKPMNAPILKNVPIKDIFCSSNNNIYLTYDTITNLNGINLLTPNLTPAIYIEAIT